MSQFATFEEAEKAGSYNNKRIAEVVSLKTRKYIQDIPIVLKEKQDIQNLLVINDVLNHFKDQKLTIVEIGGACGAFYFFISKFFPDQIKQWEIVENKEMVEAAKKNAYFENVLNFSENIDTIFQNFNSAVCIAQGAIQYIPDPLTFLSKLLSSDYHFIYISRLPVNLNLDTTVITIQPSQLRDNGPGSIDISDEIVNVASTILTKNEFFKVIEESKYKIRFRFEESESYSMTFSHKEVHLQNIGVLLTLK
ncbi:MAG TPA: methyltransferase, TIGR04325 family [Chitinophagaceae bacterium]|nr:methyltransferase, TIGR04325 family [Chitinophagaceae bacterium]